MPRGHDVISTPNITKRIYDMKGEYSDNILNASLFINWGWSDEENESCWPLILRYRIE